MKVMFAGDTHGQIGTVKKILRDADELCSSQDSIQGN